MNRWLSLAFVMAAAVSAQAAGISGKYVEARNCDVYTGPCFANAVMNLSGKNGLMAWRVDKGSIGSVKLDGLGVVAVIVASDTLGLEQTGPAKAVLIVDSRANAAQREALIGLAKEQGGKLVANVVAVESAPVDLTICECKDNSCTKLTAGNARLETRCLDAKHDKTCGNEENFYPPLAKNVAARAAVATEHGYTGKAFNQTWRDRERRGAYVGDFATR
jgi:hypothetical protein